MRENANIQLIGKRVVLVPYRAQFVPKYHQWMKDPWLLEMTASEELTIEQEYEAQQSWLSDETKLTFIVLDAEHQGLTEKSSTSVKCVEAMAGDVNIILNSDGDAEVMVMIAEESCRRKGLAMAAVELAVWFIHMKKKINRFFCKISSKNEASLTLFEKKLGWKKCGYAECFDEVELEYVVEPPAEGTKVEKPEELLHVRPFADDSPTTARVASSTVQTQQESSNSASQSSDGGNGERSLSSQVAKSRIKSRCFQTMVGDGIVDVVINGQVIVMEDTYLAMLTNAGQEVLPSMGSLNIALPSKYDPQPISSLLLGDLNNESNAIATALSQITKKCCYVSCRVQDDIAIYVPHIARCIFQEIKQLEASESLPSPP